MPNSFVKHILYWNLCIVYFVAFFRYSLIFSRKFRFQCFSFSANFQTSPQAKSMNFPFDSFVFMFLSVLHPKQITTFCALLLCFFFVWILKCGFCLPLLYHIYFQNLKEKTDDATHKLFKVTIQYQLPAPSSTTQTKNRKFSIET